MNDKLIVNMISLVSIVIINGQTISFIDNSIEAGILLGVIINIIYQQVSKHKLSARV